MNSVIKVICVVAIYSASLQSNISVHGMEDSSQTWETRVRSTLALLQNHSCWGLSKGSQCNLSIFNNLDTRKIRLFTAEGQKKLRVVLPDRKLRRLSPRSPRNDSYDAVFVLDPFPDGNFGHTVFIFLVSYGVNQTVCNKSMNGAHIFTNRNECIRRAEKRHCKNSLRLKCEINFIPLVYEKSDSSHKQLLNCRPELNTLRFADCRARESFSLPCSGNSVRCPPGPVAPEKICTVERCDHAVLIAGGWNSDTSHPRYRNNLHNVWKLLHHNMKYRKSNIVTFFGQGRKDELALHQRDKSYPVKKATVVKEYVKKLCQSLTCVDTITLYMTGPANGDGALLFWDNGNGITEDSAELYTPKQLLEDIKNCQAKRIFIVADYSYSGALINKIRGRIRRHPDQFPNLVAISSSSGREYTLRSDFTDAFVKHNKEGRTTKCVADVFKGIRQEFQAKSALSTPDIVRANSSVSNTTLSGNPCNEPWNKANERLSCQRITIIEIKKAIAKIKNGKN